jgi:hypothetical protein
VGCPTHMSSAHSLSWVNALLSRLYLTYTNAPSKIPSVFEKHLISTNIGPRKEEGSYP